MAVALGSVPFAVGAAWAKQAGWNGRVILPLALLCGVATAFALWKWMGDWQLKPKVATGPLEAKWAGLIRAAAVSGEMTHTALTRNYLLAWQEVLSPVAVDCDAQLLQRLRASYHQPQAMSDDELEMIDVLCCNRAREAAPVQMLEPQSTDVFYQMLAGRRTLLPSKPRGVRASSEAKPQSTPAPAFVLGQHVGAHGLA